MLNSVVLIGRLTKDPELRFTPNGNATCSFTLACDRQMKDAQGNKQTDFINIVVPPYRGKLAELVAEYLDKGKLAAVQGSIEVRSFDGKEGKKVYMTEIVAESVKFLSPKESPQSGEPTDPYREVSMDEDVPFQGVA